MGVLPIVLSSRTISPNLCDMYNKVCARGENCRNSHQLIGARDLARMMRANSSANAAANNSEPAQVVRTQPKAKNKNNTYTEPAFHPDHPWVKEGRAKPSQVAISEMRPRSDSSASNASSASSASGNGQGQTAGAPTVQVSAPQISAASEIAARQTVRESLAQISSSYAQIQSVQEGTWFSRMDDALAQVRQAFPESQGSPASASPRPRAQSQGACRDAPFEDPKTPNN